MLVQRWGREKKQNKSNTNSMISYNNKLVKNYKMEPAVFNWANELFGKSSLD